jgi:Holliday junction resolvase-like predicted endonuclease
MSRRVSRKKENWGCESALSALAIIGALTAAGRSFDAFYFRTNDRYELDMVLCFGKEICAVEIKLTASPGAADMARLDKTADLIKASRRFLVSKTSKTTGTGTRISCSLPVLIEMLLDIS